MPDLEATYKKRRDVLLEACTLLQKAIEESFGDHADCKCSFRAISLQDLARLVESSTERMTDFWRDSSRLIVGTVLVHTSEKLVEARSVISRLLTAQEITDTGTVYVVPPWAKPSGWRDSISLPTHLTVEYHVAARAVQNNLTQSLTLFQPLTLALSGGGIRAVLYQLGILVFLAHQNRLKHVREIVSVSGGSILAAHFLKSWPDAIGGLSGFRRVAAAVLVVCRSNIRDRIAIPLIWNKFVPRFWSSRSRGPTQRLRNEYQRIFGATQLGELSSGRPSIAIVATDAVRHERVAFTATQVLRWPIREEVPSVPEPILSQGVELSLAVTASSCYPAAFPRLVLTHEDLGITFGEFKEELNLNDGGVLTNLGVEVLVALRKLGWANDTLVLIADAERGLAAKPSNLPTTDINASLTALSMTARDCAKRELGESGIMIPFAERTKTANGLAFRTETMLFAYRTDLDCPTWQEINALMIHGAMAAMKATSDRFEPISVDLLRNTITTIIAEADGPPDLPLPTDSDLSKCGSMPLRPAIRHLLAAISLAVAVLLAIVVGIVVLIMRVIV
jgi:predicted acylesterase/phospholipase RssA